MRVLMAASVRLSLDREPSSGVRMPWLCLDALASASKTLESSEEVEWTVQSPC